MQSKAIIRKAAEAIWAIRREEEDRCDMSLDDMGGEESSVWQEAKAALEAALSAAEPVQTDTDGHKQLQVSDNTKPVAWVYAPDLEKGDGCFGNAKGEVCMSRDGKWIKVDTPLYAAPPAPSVAVKAAKTKCKNCGGNLLSWFTANRVNSVAVDGRLKSSEISCDFVLGCDECSETLRVVPADEIANQMNAALSAQVQDVAERKPLDLNVTKEWFEKRAALEGDHEIGAGRRKLTASIDPTPEELAELYRIAHRIPEGWQLVPAEPTAGMIEAAKSTTSAALTRSHATEIYRAMLAAAPAKQEGGE